ncbi:APC family permease [Acinetobacter sp. MB5]|uniref:APC family permease n=1 Tax=Acinetobacter sp. MB5 TaxID=2069438 RepID=UPI0013A6D6FC|nr:APC family permease [Acinetobacter sp. MB5]
METQVIAPAMAQTESRNKLQGSLGVGSIVFMVIAAAAPLTVVGGNVPLAIGVGNGVGAPFGFLIASIVLLIFAVGFVNMTPYVKEAGAFYSYVNLGLGDRLGMGAAYTALITYTTIQAGVYGYMGWAINDLVMHYGGAAHPWWMYSFLSVIVVAFLGYRHIELSSKILGVALILEIGIVLLMNVSIISHGGAEGISLQSFEPSTAFSPGLGLAILFALTGFIGFESTAIFRDESVQPEKTIPKATYLAVIIIGVFYTLSAWAMVVGAGPSHTVAVANQTLHGTGNMILDIAQQYTGVFTRDLMQVLLISSLFACVLSFHNVLARYQYVLACKGYMPKSLSKVHDKHGSPSSSSLLQTITAFVVLLICCLCELDPLTQVFGYMAGISTVGIVMLMLMTSVAVYVFFSKNKSLTQNKLMKTQILPVVASLALAGCLIMILMNFMTLTGGSALMSFILAVIPIFALIVGALRKVQAPLT